MSLIDSIAPAESTQTIIDTNIQHHFSIALFETTYHLTITMLTRTIVIWVGVQNNTMSAGSRGGACSPDLNYITNALMSNFDHSPVSSTVYSSDHDNINANNQDIKTLAQILTKKLRLPVSLMTTFNTIETTDIIPLQEAIVKCIEGLKKP